MRAALARFSPDVIVCGGYNYIASWATLWWAHRHQVPLLLWVESTARDRRGGHALVESLKTWFIRKCQGFVVPGGASFQYFKKLWYERRDDFTAPNAVDTEFFASGAEAVRCDAPRQRQKLNLPLHFFLFTGRLIREKGVFDLLDAYMSQPSEFRSQWGLVLVGNGPVLPQLQERVAGLAIGIVQFAGFCPARATHHLLWIGGCVYIPNAY